MERLSCSDVKCGTCRNSALRFAHLLCVWLALQAEDVTDEIKDGGADTSDN
jgi:hypothetical protein